MNEKDNQIDWKNIFNEVNDEIDKAMSKPDGLQKYLDDLDDFMNEVSEDELNDVVDKLLYNSVEKMLHWDNETIRTKLAIVPYRIIKEYLKTIYSSKNLLEGNEGKIEILKELLKKSATDKNKIPHDINQVNLCGWIAKNSIEF